MIGRFSPRSAVRVGQEVTMTLDTSRLHFFDLETGRAIDGTPRSADGDTTSSTAQQATSSGTTVPHP